MTHVLVVGGAGYIGAHTCKALARAGHTPIVFDNLSFGHRDFVRWGDLIEGDIMSRADLEAAFARSGARAVIHFAANTFVGESVTDPAKYWCNNVTGTMNLADAAHAAGVKAFVFSSSCATYGVPDRGAGIVETTPGAPINPYGRTKLVTEWMLRDYAAAYGLRTVALRYFNAAGADPDGEVGEDHYVETHLIPLAVYALMGRGSLSVFGTDYDTPDGSAVRDYIHVSDLADAHVAALGYLLAGGESDAFNLGTGRGASVLDIIATLESLSGRRVPHAFAPRREGDAPVLVADPAKARRVLGFAAQRSSLEAIVGSALEWHLARHGAPRVVTRSGAHPGPHFGPHAWRGGDRRPTVAS